MAKKIKIDVDFTEDNKLIGISCHRKDYWFAYHLNDVLKIDLKRLKDFPFYQPKLDMLLDYPLFHCFCQDDQVGYFLLSNHNGHSPLFPELKTIDFLLLAQGRITAEKLESIQQSLRTIKGVLLAYAPDTGKMKEYDNFLSDLELHMAEIK